MEIVISLFVLSSVILFGISIAFAAITAYLIKLVAEKSDTIVTVLKAVEKSSANEFTPEHMDTTKPLEQFTPDFTKPLKVKTDEDEITPNE